MTDNNTYHSCSHAPLLEESKSAFKLGHPEEGQNQEERTGYGLKTHTTTEINATPIPKGSL